MPFSRTEKLSLVPEDGYVLINVGGELKQIPIGMISGPAYISKVKKDDYLYEIWYDKPTEEYYPLYKVNGAMLGEDLQRWTYICCKRNGVEWLTPYIIAQFYQESRFNQGSVSAHLDYGLGQIWIGNHDWLRQELGKPNADFINNPYDNIEASVWLMTRYLAFRGNLNGALESYFNCGEDAGNKEYVAQVSQWFDKIEKIR